MTHVKNAVELLLLNSIAAYSPKLCPCFTARSTAIKQEIRKISIWYSQFSILCYLGHFKGDHRKGLSDLAVAANHCDLNYNGLLFNNPLQTQYTQASSGFLCRNQNYSSTHNIFLITQLPSIHLWSLQHTIEGILCIMSMFILKCSDRYISQ